MKRSFGISIFGLLLVLSALLLQPYESFAQATGATPTEVTQNPAPIPEITKEQIYQDAKKALSQIGKALAVGGEHVYKVLVKQQVVRSITWTIVSTGFFILVLITWAPWWWFNKDKFNEYMNEMFGLPMIASIVFIIVFCFSVNTIVSGFVNPEYGAIKEILNVMK